MKAARTLVAGGLAAALAVPALAADRVRDFSSQLTVGRDGGLDVVETIQVEADTQIRHGINRDFPTRYTNPDGSNASVGFRVTRVTRDGETEPYQTSSLGNGTRVRIGRAETRLSRGPHTYVIGYHTTRQIGFFTTYDELYWNVTGTGWVFPIDHAAATIILPEPAPFGRTAVYTGRQGATGTDAEVTSRGPGRISFATTKGLAPNEGLTVAAAWPKGVVAPPSASERTKLWLSDNGAGLAALGGIVALLANFAWTRRRFGSGPQPGPVVPLFSPPDDMCAAAARYVRRMAFDDRAFAAGVLGLAVKRRLRLHKDANRDTRIDVLGGGREADPAEEALAASLFVEGPSVLLDQANRLRIVAARTSIAAALKERYAAANFVTHYAFALLGILVTGLVLFAVTVVAAGTLDDGHRDGLIGGMIFAGIAATIVSVLLSVFLAARRWVKWIVAVVGIALGVALALLALGLAVQAHVSWNDVLPALLTFVGVVLAFYAFRWTTRPTVQGRALMDRIEGFAHYLGITEEERLDTMNPPDKTPELFERYLPYAIALDVENAWSERFAGVLAAAAADPARQDGFIWYTSDSGHTDVASLGSDLGSDLTSTIASASASPSSSSGGSGSSGGGSSGGGGGGGGGSGW